MESEILAACPVALVGVDPELNIVYANAAAETQLDLQDGGGNLLAVLPGLRELDHGSFGSPDGIWLLHRASRDKVQVEARRGSSRFQVEIDVRSLRLGQEELTVVAIHDMTSLNSSLTNIMNVQRELEEFNRVAIGRELRMVALKDEINQLLSAQGQEPRYVD